MELNKIVFPAPSPSYNDKLRNLIWIPSKFQSKKNDVEIKKKINQYMVKAKILNSQFNSENVISKNNSDKSSQKHTSHYIPCLYLPFIQGSDKILVYFHGNAEDIGYSYEFCDNLRKFL